AMLALSSPAHADTIDAPAPAPTATNPPDGWMLGIATIACNYGQVCTYWDTFYGGAMYYYTLPVGYCINIGEPWDNDISSIKNRTQFPVTFYTGGGCTGNLPLQPP